jgi:hypothetical protein
MSELFLALRVGDTLPSVGLCVVGQLLPLPMKIQKLENKLLQRLFHVLQHSPPQFHVPFDKALHNFVFQVLSGL